MAQDRWRRLFRLMRVGPGRRVRPGPTDDEANVAQNFADMTADPEGNFYVAWIGSHDDDPAGRGLGVARSTDFGESWEFNQLVDPSSCACCWNKMIAPHSGQVHVLYREHGIRDMALASTTDAGEHWDLKSPVGEFNWEFPGCPHVGGGIAIAQRGGVEQLHALVWTGHEARHGLYWVWSTDGGNSWSEPQRMGGELARHADLGAFGTPRAPSWQPGTRRGAFGSRPLTTKEGPGASRTGCRRKMLWHRIPSSFTRGRTSWCSGPSEEPAVDYSGNPIGSGLTTRRQVRVSRSRQR